MSELEKELEECEDLLESFVDLHKSAKIERAAWKEAFTATRSYYSNNNGPNATRYRAAIKQLKEMKLIK